MIKRTITKYEHIIINKSLKGLKKLYYNHFGYPYENFYYGNMPLNYGEHPHYGNQYHPYFSGEMLKDHGPYPFVVNINEVTKQNNNYRTTLWTGKHFQITLMTIQPGEDIGLERHPNIDQFLRIEQGYGISQMGKNKDNLDYTRMVHADSAVIVPAGTWHNITNTGNIPLKLYSIYAPPKHPFGTVQPTKRDAMTGNK